MAGGHGPPGPPRDDSFRNHRPPTWTHPDLPFEYLAACPPSQIASEPPRAGRRGHARGARVDGLRWRCHAHDVAPVGQCRGPICQLPALRPDAPPDAASASSPSAARWRDRLAANRLRPGRSVARPDRGADRALALRDRDAVVRSAGARAEAPLGHSRRRRIGLALGTSGNRIGAEVARLGVQRRVQVFNRRRRLLFLRPGGGAVTRRVGLDRDVCRRLHRHRCVEPTGAGAGAASGLGPPEPDAADRSRHPRTDAGLPQLLGRDPGRRDRPGPLGTGDHLRRASGLGRRRAPDGRATCAGVAWRRRRESSRSSTSIPNGSPATYTAIPAAPAGSCLSPSSPSRWAHRASSSFPTAETSSRSWRADQMLSAHGGVALRRSYRIGGCRHDEPTPPRREGAISAPGRPR